MTQSDGFEGIPELPEPIIHHMLSILTTKEVKIVSLSEAWLSAWQTRPSLQFIDHYLLSSEWDYNNDFPTSEGPLKLADYTTFTHSIFQIDCEYKKDISILVLKLNNLLALASPVDSAANCIRKQCYKAWHLYLFLCFTSSGFGIQMARRLICPKLRVKSAYS